MKNTGLRVQPKMNPQRFLLWAGLATIVMMFAALTSAYIVRHAQGNWVYYQLPTLFKWSTVMVVVSSVCLQVAWFTRRKEGLLFRGMLALATILGIGFCISQYLAWQELTENGIRLTGNPSGSFLYLISGVHLFHLAIGVIILLGTFLMSFGRKNNIEQLVKDENPNQFLKLEFATTYWHFVGILWIYLYLFFQIFSAPII